MRLFFVSILGISLLSLAFGCHKRPKPAPTPPQKTATVTPKSKVEKKKVIKKKEETKVATPTKPKAPEKKSAFTTAIEDLTGKTTIDRGLKAKADIKRISEKHNKDLNELLGE